MLKRLLVPAFMVVLGAFTAGGCTDNSGNGNFVKMDATGQGGTSGADGGGSGGGSGSGGGGGAGGDAATSEGGGDAGPGDVLLDGVSEDVTGG